MKGGDVAVLYALKAMAATGTLDDSDIIVAFMGLLFTLLLGLVIIAGARRERDGVMQWLRTAVTQVVLTDSRDVATLCGHGRHLLRIGPLAPIVGNILSASTG